MKIKTLSMFAAALTLAACGGAEEPAVEETVPEVVEEVVEEAPSMTAVSVNHAVADFAKWNAVYQEKSNPETRIGVLQSVDNPKMVHVAEATESHAAAQAQMGSEEFKASMAGAGVVGEPAVTFLNMKWMNKEAGELVPGAYIAHIKHEVSDYAAWKEKFDADQENRLAAGMTTMAIATIEGNDNMVMLVFGVADLDKCKTMIADPKMGAKMAEAGVVGKPEVSYWVVPQKG